MDDAATPLAKVIDPRLPMKVSTPDSMRWAEQIAAAVLAAVAEDPSIVGMERAHGAENDLSYNGDNHHGRLWRPSLAEPSGRRRMQGHPDASAISVHRNEHD